MPYRTDTLDLVASLNDLSSFYDENSAHARRNLRSTIEKLALQINSEFLCAADSTQITLDHVEEEVNALADCCKQIAAALSSSAETTSDVISTTERLKQELEVTTQRQEIVNFHRVGVASGYETISQSRGGYKDAYTLPQSATTGTGSLWSRQPFEQFGVAERNGAVGEDIRNRSNPINIDNNASTVDAEAKLLQSFRNCVLKLIKLEGSEWLFGQSDGVDEELIDKVAAREKFIYEAETREANQVGHMGEPQVSSVPNCGDGCVWRADLIVSFGVWCIHRVLDLSLMESRPELWGKYTYVLNRLQGVIDPAFSKLRTPMTPCFCLQIPASHQRASPPSASNGMLPPAARPAKGKCTTAVTLLDLIKDVEISISCRKGRTGTAAGDVAFPKGKENLASVLKRYKRRLSNKPTGMNQDGPGSRKNLNAAASVYGSLG